MKRFDRGLTVIVGGVHFDVSFSLCSRGHNPDDAEIDAMEICISGQEVSEVIATCVEKEIIQKCYESLPDCCEPEYNAEGH